MSIFSIKVFNANIKISYLYVLGTPELPLVDNVVVEADGGTTVEMEPVGTDAVNVNKRNFNFINDLILVYNKKGIRFVSFQKR